MQLLFKICFLALLNNFKNVAYALLHCHYRIILIATYIIYHEIFYDIMPLYRSIIGNLD